jgi:hypothetical protein
MTGWEPRDLPTNFNLPNHRMETRLSSSVRLLLPTTHAPAVVTPS